MALDFDFKLTSSNDYQLDFFLEINSKAMQYSFNKSKKKLEKKLKKPIDGDLNVIEEFEIPAKHRATFLPVLYRGLRSKVADVSAQVRADGNIIIQNYSVKNALYTKRNDVWVVRIMVVGQWSK